MYHQECQGKYVKQFEVHPNINPVQAKEMFTRGDDVLVNTYVKSTKYKHLKKGAHQSHLGRQKMAWFLAD